MVPRLKELYDTQLRSEIMKKHNLKNINQVPVFEKIIVNVGVGEAKENNKLLQAAVEELTAITGQKAVITRAKKSISNFKIRKGIAIGAKVTLRGNMMWEFFDRFVNIALPRVRDFRGLDPNSFDKFNNYSLGIKEQIIFPEVNYDKVEKIHGMDITFVIKNRNKKEAVKDFLNSVGMPFRKEVPKEPVVERRPRPPLVYEEEKKEKEKKEKEVVEIKKETKDVKKKAVESEDKLGKEFENKVPVEKGKEKETKEVRQE